MLFRLALALGKTVSELGQSLSYKEFRQWCAYYQIEPWGEYRADLRTGILAATVSNIFSAYAGTEQQAQPIDFMPYVDQRADNTEPNKTGQALEPELTDEQLAAWADAALFGITPDNS